MPDRVSRTPRSKETWVHWFRKARHRNVNTPTQEGGEWVPGVALEGKNQYPQERKGRRKREKRPLFISSWAEGRERGYKKWWKGGEWRRRRKKKKLISVSSGKKVGGFF